MSKAGPRAVAGVPPDYFSATGQLWGNPLYRWDVSAMSGHRWWIDRVRASLKLFDLVRLDHFRGFEAFWEVPATASTAAAGKWVKGPGAELFQALQTALKELPFVAENLGVITPEVEGLRQQFGFPGMSLLQFAFGNDPQGPQFSPAQLCSRTRGIYGRTRQRHHRRMVDEFRSWRKHTNRRRHSQRARFHSRILGISKRTSELGIHPHFLGIGGKHRHHSLARCIGLGSDARMNLPGTISGNWRWRLQTEGL